MRTRVAVVLAALSVLVGVLLAVGVVSLLNDRTDDRVRADEDSQRDRAETRRIVDDLLCELAALRDAAEARDPTFAIDIPPTVPREDYRTAPCPPPRSTP